MKKLILTLTLCFIASFSNAQIDPWLSTIPGVPTFDFQPLGDLIEKDNSILILSSNKISEYSHYGGRYNEIFLEDSGTSGYNFYFYFDELMDGTTPYYVAAHRGGTTGNMYLYTYFKNGTIGTSSFELSDNIADEEIKGPAGVKADDGTYLFFGNDKIYKVAVVSPTELNIVWDKPNTGGPVAAVINTDDGYVSISYTGTLNKYDEEVDLDWSTQLDFNGTDITAGSDGYLVCGHVDNTSQLKSLDQNGNVNWEQSYEGFKAYGMGLNSSGEVFLCGKENTLSYRYIKLSSAGDLIWTQIGQLSSGINILPSKYGQGIWVQTGGILGEGGIIYADNDGNVSDLLSNTPTAYIQANNIKTTASAVGNFFNDANFDSGYFWPKGATTSTIFTSALWLSGFDDNQNLHTAYNTYLGFNGTYDAGPIDAASPSFWNRAWSVSAKAIHEVRMDLSDGTQNLPIPRDLLEWPAIGNPNICFDGVPITVDVDLAPFEDVNNDGIYNVYDGDYPVIKGDEMLWWIMNDLNELAFDFVPFEVEIIGNLYAFNCDDEVVYNASFLDLIIHNKSDQNYSDVQAGLFTDYDLGCYTDDYLGSIPELNTFYVYNDDAIDDELCAGGVDGFGENPPIQSITFLNQEMTSFIYYGNPSVGPPQPAGTGGPTNSAEVNLLLNSTWIDGTPLTYGEDGYDPTGTGTPTPFALPGNPSEDMDWSMCSESFSEGDRRSIPAGNTFNLMADEIVILSYGMLTHAGNNDLPCPDSDALEGGIVTLQNAYEEFITNGSPSGLVVDLGPDQNFESGETYTLDAGAGGFSYLWSTGATTQSITTDLPGTFWVEVSSLFGCIITDTIVIDESIVNTFEPAAATFKIYPNPSSGQFNVDFGNEVPQTLSVYNLIGQQLKTFDAKDYLPNSTASFSLSNSSSGMYLIVGSYENGLTATRRLLIK